MAEILISLGLLSVAGLALMGLLMGAQAGAGANAETLQANRVGESHIQNLKSGSFDRLKTAIGGSILEQINSDGRDYWIETQVERHDPAVGNPDYNVLDLNTVVNWRANTADPGGRSRVASVRLYTHVALGARY